MKKETNELQVRLNKFLGSVGIASRRHADEIIKAGKVSINGKVVSNMGTLVYPLTDIVEVEGKKVSSQTPKYYLLMNKPRGCICSVSDPRGRPSVIDLLNSKIKMFPVGRLDYNTEGIILLTNDGEFSQLMTHPKNKIKKVYLVKVKGIPNERVLKTMKKGVMVDGKIHAFSSVSVERITGKNSWIKVTLFEGKNRHIHKVCSVTGNHVIRMERTEYGNIILKNIKPGEFRDLTFREVSQLKKAASK